MADRLSIYNRALAMLGERALASLTENQPSRHALDLQWAPALQFMLEQGLWKNSLRTVEIAPDGDFEAQFGFENVFSLPEDFVDIAMMSATGDMKDPIRDYEIEAASRLYASVEYVYLQYVSNSASYGLDLAAWPEAMVSALVAYLAFLVGPSVTNGRTDKGDAYSIFERRLSEAKRKNAMQNAAKEMPRGRWSRARAGNSTSHRRA